MKVRMILLRVFSGILAFVCVLCLALNGIGLKQMLDCKTYWEKQGADATENFDKLEDGISQLRANEIAYQEGVDAYLDGLEEYEQGEAALQAGAAQLNNGQSQYDDGAAKLADAHQQYDDNVAKLNQAKAELEAGKAQLEQGKAEVAAGEAELAAHQQEYEEGKAKLAEVAPIYAAAKAAKDEFDSVKAQYDDAVARGDLIMQAALKDKVTWAEIALNASLQGYSLAGIIQEYEAGQAKVAEYEAGQAKVQEGKQKIAEGEAKIAASEKQIADAEAKLNAAKNTLDQKDQELAAAGGQLANGYAQYEAGKKELEAGAAQLADGLAKLGEYEGGQDQVAAGLDMVLATDTYYNRAKEALVKKISDRLGQNFTYWTLDANGEPVYLNDQRFLDLDKAMQVVDAGRDFLTDTTGVVTKEVTGRLIVWAIAAAAVLSGILAAILGLCGKRLGALIGAIVSVFAAMNSIVLALFFGTENPMSVISGTGTVGIVLAGVIALFVAGVTEIVFSSIALAGKNPPKAAETLSAEA